MRPTASHPVRAFSAQFTHTLALLLWFAAGLAFAARIPELGGAILAVIAVNGVFAFAQEYRAERVVESLMRRVAVQAHVLRDGAARTLPAIELVPGDIVHLAAGDVVPADCVVLSSDNLTVDLSMLTGESSPVERSAVAAAAPPGKLSMSEVSCLVPSGGGVSTGTATAMVFATGSASSIGVVADLVAGLRHETSVLERQVAELSRLTGVIAVLAGTSTLALVSLFTHTTFVAALTFGTGVIVALVPEGLLPTLSVSLAIGARRMAERGAAVRRLSAAEVVGSVTVICSDKTGTLTENTLTVTGFVAPDGSTRPSRDALLAAVLCNDATEDIGGLAGNPLDVALWRWAQTAGMNGSAARSSCPRIDTTAFEARTRYMRVTCQVDGISRVFVKGAPEAVLPIANLSAMPRRLAAAVEESTARGERVLMLAVGEEGQQLSVALLLFHDPPRSGVPGAIASCARAGVRVVMLTGDHPETARAVARAIGLADGDIPLARGDEVDAMSDAALRDFLGGNAVIARVDPQQKLRIVRLLQKWGEVVIVTGDGVNDAPALRAADVGVAMGLRGSEVAKQSADVVLADDNFATIVSAIEEGRSIHANIRRFVSYVFTSNVAEMTPFLVYIFLPVPLPLAIMQALAISMATDLLPALALGTEPPTSRAMEESPEPPRRPLLTRRLGMLTFLFYGIIESALGLGGYFAYYAAQGWRPFGSFSPFESIHGQATAVTFVAIVGGQVGCLSAQRGGTLRQRLSLKSNHWIALGLAFELSMAFALVYTPGLNTVFATDPVPLVWLLVVPIAACAFVLLDQTRRWVSW